MNVCEAERAFREELPCETVAPDINTMKCRALGVPVGMLIERHESRLTNMFLIFPSGTKSQSRYQIELIKLTETQGCKK